MRDAMCIAVPNGKKGLNDDGENVDMKAIQTAVTAFRNSDAVKEAVKQELFFRNIEKQLSNCNTRLSRHNI